MAQILKMRRKPGRKARRSGRFGRSYGFVAFGLVALFGAAHQSQAWMPAGLAVLQPPEPAPHALQAPHVARFGVCGAGPRIDCVVDGDTFYIDGVKVRVADINTPEIGQPRCAREAELGARAARRFRELLNAGPVQLRPVERDEDRYGRKLRTVHGGGRSLGQILVGEGLAERWTGRKGDWCA